MKAEITLYIHHGSEIVQERGIKYYNGGKVEYVFNQKLDVLSIFILQKYVRSDLGYKVFKMYWHKSGVKIVLERVRMMMAVCTNHLVMCRHVKKILVDQLVTCRHVSKDSNVR